MVSAIQTLSTGDAHVLAQVFDPESAPQAPAAVIDENLSSDPYITDARLLQQLKERERSAIKEIEACPSKDPADKETYYQRALALFSAIVKEQPQYASAYNNRAQLVRWRYGDRGTLIQSSTWNQDVYTALSGALEDLDTAISHVSPTNPTTPVSPAQGRLLAQAHTQRAAILYAASKDVAVAQKAGNSVLTGSRHQQWDRMKFEEEGSRSFFVAGVYGSEIGKAMAVKANPYARLCGGIVKEALKREGACG
ncbi:hypothetical protein K402DRAFT_190428 [Aulographum hederae CBS 113979]|uniref:Uncharacterized protein n=1 Tax=Aulographum hederae CBS 113979 TaxID=1176131 RepID=A0A6G1GPU5_9PEZI|nr:hypothetical protein K402DRAFT_190428 [Aulographum hederae CBS 113979]